jgi:hypothetical protein
LNLDLENGVFKDLEKTRSLLNFLSLLPVIRSVRSEEDEESQKDYLADRRGLRNVIPDKEPSTIAHNNKRKVKPNKNQPKNEYEKIMEYVKGLSAKK